MKEVLEEGQEADLEIGDFQEEVIMNAPIGQVHMAKGALTAALDAMEAALDTGSMKKEAVRIAVQELMTADTGQEGTALAMENQVHMEGAINHILPLKCS